MFTCGGNLSSAVLIVSTMSVNLHKHLLNVLLWFIICLIFHVISAITIYIPLCCVVEW